MKIKIFSCILVVLFILGGCKENENNVMESSAQSTALTAENEEISSTAHTQTEESINNSMSREEVPPYGLQAPNEVYKYLIVTGSMKVIDPNKGTDTRGRDYLNNNGYSSVSETDTMNPSIS